MNFVIHKSHKSFQGTTHFVSHESISTKTSMNLSYHLPCQKDEVENVIIWLSGLTCNEENFITKAGVQSHLEGTKTVVICPDTSPRGLEIEGADKSYDFGTGASFYVNATSKAYKDHYNMYDYIASELPKLISKEFGVKNISLMGHSMGGHGALVIGLRNPDVFQSISAFSPIVNPTNCPWGQKALRGYLGDNEESWSDYDATKLIEKGLKSNYKILVDQGTSDEFLEKELLTNHFISACEKRNQKLNINFREGYDHSYYFISSFIKEHIAFHLKALS